MMDFSKVTGFVIPEGTAIKIFSGSSVLWERPGQLPSAYQQVEYIATDGNQIIDTGVLASNHSEGIQYVFRGNVTAYQSTALIYWFGALANGCRSGNAFINTASYIGMLIGGSGTEGYMSYDAFPAIGSDFELVARGTPKNANHCVITMNGTQFIKGALVNSEMPNANIYLFTANGTSAATTANRKYYGKLYSFTMDTMDGRPIRNFVPCYRKSDGVIGLYDTVEGVFYTNRGSGDFTKGPDILWENRIIQ